jgi:rubrerythrin
LRQTLPPLLAVAWPLQPARAAPYPVTAEAMRAARENEMGVYHRYTEFGRRAQADGYRGIAYLFAAFAAAEFIHASNFGRVLSRLNVEVPPLARPEVKAGSTRDNLLVAAGLEAASVDDFYPALLEKIRPEGHEDAMTVVQWAWNTEKQHREKIRQIQRWSPAFFEQVAKQIDTKTGQYFVCQICGNTVNRVPPGNCQVCSNPNKHFRLIDPPA